MQVELHSNHKWRCYGIQLSQNGVFVASAYYPADVFCRQGLKQPLKVRNVRKFEQTRKHFRRMRTVRLRHIQQLPDVTARGGGPIQRGLMNKFEHVQGRSSGLMSGVKEWMGMGTQ